MSCDDTIAERLMQEHVVIFGSMGYEGVNFDEGVRIEEKVDSVPRSSTASSANGFQRFAPTSESGTLTS
jgi:hypothetical protein